MSRFIKKPIQLPEGVQITLENALIKVKGPKGQLQYSIPESFLVMQEGSLLWIKSKEAIGEKQQKAASKSAMAGTVFARIRNLIQGVSEGYQKELSLMGVGYRAQVKGEKLELNLGFSHPVNFDIPAGVVIKTPSVTEIVLEGIDKQKVGQAAAKIKMIRPVEVYKGKGVRYKGERVLLKETKKK
jgi:large subunit ribosomal protein L6